jgi:hypothetical protein
VTWFVGILACVFLGAAIWLAIWSNSLNKALAVAVKKAVDAQRRYEVERINCQGYLVASEQYKSQLSALRGEYDAILQQVEDGNLCDAASVAAALRGSVLRDP